MASEKVELISTKEAAEILQVTRQGICKVNTQKGDHYLNRIFGSVLTGDCKKQRLRTSDLG